MKIHYEGKLGYEVSSAILDSLGRDDAGEAFVTNFKQDDCCA